MEEYKKSTGAYDYEDLFPPLDEVTIDKNIYQNYTVLNKFEINEKKSLNFETFINLIKMTPLTKFKVNDDINYNSIDQITIALNIYVLKRKENK